MFEAATGIYRFYAHVSTDDVDVGRCFCDLTVNPYAPRDMSVVLHFDGTAPAVAWDGALTIAMEGIEVVTDGFTSSSFAVFGHEARRVRSGVERVTWTDWFEDGDSHLALMTVGFRFPVTALTSRSSGIAMQHDSAGLIRGEVEEVGEALHVTPPKLVALSLNGVEIKLGNVLNFYTSGRSRYPEEHVVQESLLVVTIPASGGLNETLERARGVAEAALRLVSLVDRDRILWTRENATGRDGEGGYVVESKTVRWASPPSERGAGHYSGDRIGTLRQLVTAYERLDSDARAWVDRAVSEFGVANCSPTMEVSLIYWHSVLDFLRERLGYKGSPIGHRVAALCDDRGISMEGTAPPETVAALQADKDSKRKDSSLKFPFTALRNDVTHHGFDSLSGRHVEVLEARGQARALCERILLSYLGVDYNETILGTVSRW